MYSVIVVYVVLNIFIAGYIFRETEDNNEPFKWQLLYVGITLVFGSPAYIGAVLWDAAKAIGAWIEATLQLKGWIHYFRRGFDEITGDELLRLNNRCAYFKKRKRLTLAQKHFIFFTDLLNIRYGHRLEKLPKEELHNGI